MKKSILRKYARLIARTGANIQKNQPVIIRAQVDQYEFITILVDECYKAGASRVRIDWGWQEITKLHYRHMTLRNLSKVEPWEEAKLKQQADELPATIYVLSEDPAGLAGVNQEKMQKSSMARYPIIKPYRDLMENRYQWTIAAVPSPAWAAKVFPGMRKSAAVEALWKAILASVHVDEGNDSMEAWRVHNENFKARCKWLNDHHFDTITYKSANGTDFTASLIPEGVWCGGGEDTIQGVFFNPNMPTEEIFTSPMKGKAEGKLVSTKPLSYQGQIINHFSITFKDGKAVSWEAKEGKELLDKMISMDEGAAYLGELALIPCDSPINNSGILYYETLFDENACCHVALGRGFNDCIDGYQTRTNEECRQLGINDSMIHVDFMIGAEDLTVTGYKDGVATPIFVNGNWAE